MTSPVRSCLGEGVGELIRFHADDGDGKARGRDLNLLGDDDRRCILGLDGHYRSAPHHGRPRGGHEIIEPDPEHARHEGSQEGRSDDLEHGCATLRRSAHPG